MSDAKRYWRVAVPSAGLGLLITCTFVAYLYATYPNRNLRVESVLSKLCPFSWLTLIYLDLPSATVSQYARVWTVVAILNAALYGAVGATVAKLLRVLRDHTRIH
jgi:hypothetical protein